MKIYIGCEMFNFGMIPHLEKQIPQRFQFRNKHIFQEFVLANSPLVKFCFKTLGLLFLFRKQELLERAIILGKLIIIAKSRKCAMTQCIE